MVPVDQSAGKKSNKLFNRWRVAIPCRWWLGEGRLRQHRRRYASPQPARNPLAGESTPYVLTVLLRPSAPLGSGDIRLSKGEYSAHTEGVPLSKAPFSGTVVFRCVILAVAVLMLPSRSGGEAMLQYFNTSWNAIAQKMPELAEAGYDSLWLPPPTKAGSGLSVGYDEFDAFDLGNNSSGTAPSVSTNYGTQSDLINLVQVAHRFGIRVYLDNVSNHRGFTVPGYNASTPITYYPGMVPEDFHLLTTPQGFYQNTYDIADWNSSWDVIYESLEGLCDIANEPGTTNLNFGANVGDTFPKISFVRTPNHPDFYCYDPNGNYVGFGPNNGLTTAEINANPSAYSEYVGDFENRAVRWEIDTTKCDGIRLDAVKSVRDDFYGAEYGSDMNQSTYGYCGQIQLQYNLTHNLNPSNLRASNFNTEVPRTNAVIFGEHLGAPPAQDPYINAGMRLLDNNLNGALDGDLPYGPLNGFDAPGGNGLPEGENCTVAYVQSADYGYAAKQQLQYAFILARQGLPTVYTDGFNYAPILGSDGKAFPANSYNDYLGEFNDTSLTSMLYVHNQFARGNQVGLWSDNSTVCFERQDNRENTSMTASDATVLLFLMNGNGGAGQAPNSGFSTDFPMGAYLWQYARGTTDAGDKMTGFYYTVGAKTGNQTVSDLIIPKDGYFCFSWRTPEQSNLWTNNGGQQITILQNGQPAPTMTYTRTDGPNGDPNFNPYGVANAVPGSYSYPWTIPCVTGTNVSFVARADGSTQNMIMELDGGVDINSQMGLGPQSGEKRDNPPAAATDVFLGYEQMGFADRENAEKFAAVDTTRCQIGSAGSETYITTFGSEQFTENDGPTGVNSSYNTAGNTQAAFVYHDPSQSTGITVSGTIPQQYSPTAGGVTLWAQTNSVGAGFNMWIYYTTDGSYPEGAGGVGIGTTQTVQMNYYSTAGANNWWDGTIPAVTPGAKLIYKIGCYQDQSGGYPVSSVFPANASAVAQKLNMMTTFNITNFNPATALVYPNNDYAVTQTGLSQGFHVLRAREFLNRSNPTRASIYNTAVQTFYYDTMLPQGQIVYPANGSTLSQSQYGVVVRTDNSVTAVEYNIQDSNTQNDDGVTGVANGNGLNASGSSSWVAATELAANPLVTSTYPNEWRFNYVNIPSNGPAVIQVRLKKLTSSSNDALSDAAGHYTTLTATVNTAAPLENMFVAYPQTDGQTVGQGYVMKVWFTNDLASGGTASFINNTVISIASSESGSPANAVVQPKSGMYVDAFGVGPGGGYDELAFPLPNLYNGEPNFLSTIIVTSTTSGGLTLTATRLVKATPVTTVLDNILTPPEVDANGDPYQIVLPQAAHPTAAQRTTPIVVQTDTNAVSVAINFTSGPAVSSTNIVLTGTTLINNTENWTFAWNNIQQGSYMFNAVVTEANGSTATTNWTATVVYEELVTSSTTGKLDTDDDGIPDAIESTAVALPSGDPDLWTDDQVHRWAISSKTNALSPDTDNDGLPDGLELGLSAPMALSGTQAADTNTSTSTNGITPNFQPDLDPPVYNTDDNQNWPSGQNYGYFGTWPFNEANSRTDQIAGTMTNPNSSDTDGVGIPDGLADLCYGVVTAANGNPVLDANGHIEYYPVHKGRVDIIPDVTGTQTAIEHPPTIYNTSTINRTAVLGISPNAMWLETDPNSADTTSCGMSDGAKDVNKNGIVDLAIIDRNQTDSSGNFKVLATMSNPLTPVTVQGSANGSQAQTFYYLDFCYPYLEPQSGNTYFQNAINVSNALAGGGAASANSSLFYSAALDKNRLNAVFRPNGQIRPDGLDVEWLELDPRRYSTSGDGLPDGWKVQYGLNPFDDGVIGNYNLNTGKVITNTNNGPTGILNSEGITNLQAYVNGDNPYVGGTQAAPAPGQIAIGPVPGNTVTYGAVTNNNAWSGWTAKDQVALDYYDGGGVNYEGEDEYSSGDGFDSSRDMVAFYAHDGGAVSQGGDGNFYFRVDYEDLLPYAEEGNLDVYVAINFGSSGTGEYDLPDNLRTGTKMGWQAVVACYQSNDGNVYLWDPTSATHTTGIGQILANGLSTYGITVRNQNSVDSSGNTNGFKQAYFDSTMSACDFSISRQALIDAGWDGLDASKLTYEVFTTRDGTQPGGAGDLAVRSNIHDTFYDDWIASDYGPDQTNIDGAKSVLDQWAGMQARNDNGKKVKVISIIHGNEAIQPGSYIQNLINTGSGAGFYRPLDVHQAYNVPLTMHITPTLAAAIQWASVAPGSAQAYQDGPTLNKRIASMIASGQIDLVSSTFSDHILKYFGSAFNGNNVALANKFLQGIYGQAPSSNVFWLPERVANASVLSQVQNLGFGYTFIDQTQHIFNWFGWAEALNDDAYRINSINGMNVFVINDNLGQYLFQTQDGGPSTLVRQLLNQKARDSEQDQVIIFENSWESFATKANADAYDANIAWMASRPWIQIVTPDQIVNGQVDTSVPPNGSGTQWGTVNRGTGLTDTNLPTTSTVWINHASNGNYDNWYNGASLYESLYSKQFNIHDGLPVPSAWGINTGSGIAASSWNAVAGLSGSNPGLSMLAQATLHASAFETGFHTEDNTDLAQFSTGAFVSPNTDYQTIAPLATWAQSQTRFASIYTAVDAWANAAAAGTYTTKAVAQSVDIDQDGVPEYLLYNDRVFAEFKSIGGRMVNAWVRDVVSGNVFQALGNPVGYAGSGSENEGQLNLDNPSTSGTQAYRTSGFKDLFAQTGGAGVGNNNYVNNIYTVAPAASGIGWTFTSSDGLISKTVTLGVGGSLFNASYSINPAINQLYVRFGLSPNLCDLLINGQANLESVTSGNAGEFNVVDQTPQRSVRSFVKYGGTSGYYNGLLNPAAVDQTSFNTVNMRNQAQTQQVEISGSGTMNIAVGFETNWTDVLATGTDGIPDWWRLKYFGHTAGEASDLSRAGDDPAGDGLTNMQKYILMLDPTKAEFGGMPSISIIYNGQNLPVLSFPTLPDRLYGIYYSSSLAPNANWVQAGGSMIGTGSTMQWTDDGSQTGGAPSASQNRFYKLQVSVQ
jgi:hypothetical protein